jgi:hypothetical protein
MKLTPAILTLLVCALLAPAVPAQSWVTELVLLVQDECVLAVPPAGQVSVVRNQLSYSGFTELAPDGQLVREFKHTDAALSSRVPRVAL